MRTNPPHKRRKKASLDERQAEMLLASADLFAERCKESFLVFLRPNCEMLVKQLKHHMNGDELSGWYCYQCDFETRSVAKAAEHDGSVEFGVMPAINPDGSRSDCPRGPAHSWPVPEQQIRLVAKALGISFQEAQRSMYAAEKLRQGARP